MNKNFFRYFSFGLVSVAALDMTDFVEAENTTSSSVKSKNFEMMKQLKNGVSNPDFKNPKGVVLPGWARVNRENKNVVINGLDRISKEVVCGYLALDDTKLSVEERIDRSIKNLQRSGMFSEVDIKTNGTGQFVVTLKENPIIEEIAFDGNTAVADDMLKQTLSGVLVQGRAFAKSVIQEAVSNLQTAYRVSGFSSATIIPKVINLKGNKVNIVFEIKEGKRSHVERIIFCGNRAFSSSFLKDKIVSKEKAFWRFWNSESSVFGEDKIYGNIENLKSFYRNNGYPDIKIIRVSSEMDFKREKSYLTISLNEGHIYKFKNLKIRSEISGIKADNYKKCVHMFPNDTYSISMINQGRYEILRKLAKDGRTFVDVVTKVNLDKKNHTADVVYKIIETERFFVDKIEIYGNNITADYVIRQYFNTQEGDPFSTWAIEKAKGELEDTGFFDSVDISIERTDIPDKVKLIVKVKEKESTNSINLACSMSDADGLGGMISYTNTNFKGRGQVFSSDLQIAQKSLNGSVSLSNPNFIWKDVTGTIEVGGDFRNRKKEEHAKYKTYFVSPSIGYRINDNLSHTISATATFGEKLYVDNSGKKHKKITGLEPGVSTIMIDEFGKFKCGELSSILSYADNDKRFNSRRGYVVSLRNTYAGLLGDVRFFKNSVSGEYYMPFDLIDDKTIFSIRGQIGRIHEIKNVKSSFRYQMGGDGSNFRGFDACGVSPREYLGENSIGGTNFWTLSFALRHPLSDSEVGLFGSAFIDVGSVWGIPKKYRKSNPNRVQNALSSRYGANSSVLDIKDDKTARVSVGFSLEWRNCPLGAPLTFSFAVPLKKSKIDKRKTFTLSGVVF